MRYLLDTHILLWIEDNNSELADHVKDELDNYTNHVFISIYSFHEIALKQHIKKIKLNISLEELMDKTQSDYSIKILYPDKKHIIEYSHLTLNPGHSDPFDHIIISQAIAENLTLISADQKFPFYRRQGLLLLENN